MSDETVKYLLDESRIPTHWINLLGDLPGDPLPPLHPGTKAAGRSRRPDTDLPDVADHAGGLAGARDRDPRARPRRLQAVAPDAAVPGPPARARRSTPRRTSTTSTRASPPPARTSPTRRSPRPTRTRRPGSSGSATETGAGQWGSALAFACSLFGLECEVFMVGSSYDQKPYRRSMMETWGATCHRSPSDLTQSGKANAGHPTGSLGIAISEAVEVAAQRDDTNYSLGSVLNHVCLHQTIIGQEAIEQMAHGRREPRRDRRLRRRRLELRRADVPVHPRGPARQRARRASWRPSRRPARRSPAACTATTSATPPG